MDGSKVINKYFEKTESKLNYKRTDGIVGFKYESLDREKEGHILRFFIDGNLDACISKYSSREERIYSYQYEKNNDILIIGFCLEGKIGIGYRERKTLKKGQVFYFRPDSDFDLELSNHSFLYYIIDLKKFKKYKCQKGCKKNTSFLDSYVDCICKKGGIYIKEAPYMMKSCMDEIKAIENIDVDNLFQYASIKGQLFNYLSCLLKSRLDGNPSFKSRCKIRQCKRDRVSQAKKIIIDNLDKHITIDEIADRLGVSPYKLQKSFKKVEGTTVYNFILKVRIDNSKILLRNTDQPIIEISQKIGYINPSKFSTAFKRITGYTPSQYREANRD